MTRLPVHFISHGGGPWSYMDDGARAPYAKLEKALAEIPRDIGATTAAILMISAHWEENEFALTSSPAPPMIYDYGGFPDYTYRIRYDAPGAPALAERTRGADRRRTGCRPGWIPPAVSTTGCSRRCT